MEPAIMQAILQDRKIAYMITNRDLNILTIEGAVHILSETEQAGHGRHILQIVPELIGGEKVLSEILNGELPRFELAWVNRETTDGSTIYLNLVDLPYRDAQGTIQGLLHIVEELSNAGEVEQQLAQQRNELRLLKHQLTQQNLALAAINTELEQLDDIKSQFIAIAAHELRSPLTTIKVYANLLLTNKQEPLTDKQRARLELVLQSVDNLVALIEDLLDVTRMEMGHIELNMQPTNIADLAQNVVNEFTSRFRAKRQKFTQDIPLDLPPVLCDQKRTMQILVNLLSNAHKYTLENGAITLSITPLIESGFVKISIMDTGVGISAEDQLRLFRRFFRAKSSVLTKVSGTGLGLHISQGLVELHGGKIWFESELDKGSIFHITLPIVM
ncbi:MAG: hypothetical protein JXA33_07770 [Anaerolineae bacterium]|nr:hypothetical protein [Anaerolineae bacterium]